MLGWCSAGSEGMKASEGCEMNWVWAGTERGIVASASAGVVGGVAALDAEVKVEVGAIVSLTIHECVAGLSFRHDLRPKSSRLCELSAICGGS